MYLRSFRDCSPWFVLATLSACQHASVAPAITTATTKTVAVVPAPAQAADSLAVTPAPADASPFVEVVRLGYAARLTVAGPSTFLSTEKLLLGVHDDGVRIEPVLLEGLQRGPWQYPLVFGSMPESGWALHTNYSERTSRSSLSRWNGSEWVDADALVRHRNVIGISSWSEGRTLALVEGGEENQLGFVQLGGPRGVPVPQFARTSRNEYSCVHGIQPTAMRALPSGEVLLAATRCAVGPDGIDYRGAIMETWAPGQTRGKVSVLPGFGAKDAVSGGAYSIAATSASDVFVAGARQPQSPAGQEAKEQAYVAHFDGKAWRALSAPPIERIDELQSTPDGTLWALSNNELWTTNGAASDSATWERVVLPQLTNDAGEHAVTSFWVQDNEQVWATLGMDDFSYLVRTKRGATPLSTPPDEQIAQLSKAFDPMAAYECEAPTLVLLTLSRNAPKDADMPSVRAALRGHGELEGKAQFVELPFLTRRYLAVRGDRDSLIATQEILSDAKIPGVAPEMRCLVATPTRTLTIDFGSVKPDLPEVGKASRGKSASRY
jgi:hypothetical protein